MHLLTSFFIIAFLVTGLQANPELAEPADSSCSNSLADSTIEADEREGEFQEEVDDLFAPESLAIDTIGWSTKRINVSRFDYRTMLDTFHIVLANKGRTYVHPAIGAITSPFGLRRWLWHYGIDIKVKTGDTIRCAFDGIVRVIQNDRRGYGKVVVVRHPDGLETLYGHLSRSSVSGNQRINAGDIVGLGGNTGRSTGSHLHFEVRFYGEPFDPNSIIDFANYALREDTLVLTRNNFAYLAEARKTICHIVRKGETLGGIARRYGTTVKKICAINRIRPKTVLAIGRKLIIRKAPSSVTQLSLTEINGGE